MPRTTRCGAFGESPVVPKMLSAAVMRKPFPQVISNVIVTFDVPMRDIVPPLNVGRLHIGTDLVQCIASTWVTPYVVILVPIQAHAYGSLGQFELFSDSGFMSVDDVAPVDQFIDYTLGS